MEAVPWERLEHQQYAVHPARDRNLLGVQSVALAKMLDVALIWTDFGDDRVTFYPWVSVFVDSGDIAQVMAIYHLEPDEQEDMATSLICIRYAEWDKRRDNKQFSQAKNRKKYLQSNNQLTSQMVFLPSSSCPDLLQSVDDLIILCKDGIKFTTIPLSTRDDTWTRMPREERVAEIRCQVSDMATGSRFSFEYFPYSLENRQVEQWVKNWRLLFHGIDFANGVIPTNDVMIDWRLSIYDFLYS